MFKLDKDLICRENWFDLKIWPPGKVPTRQRQFNKARLKKKLMQRSWIHLSWTHLSWTQHSLLITSCSSWFVASIEEHTYLESNTDIRSCFDVLISIIFLSLLFRSFWLFEVTLQFFFDVCLLGSSWLAVFCFIAMKCCLLHWSEAACSASHSETKLHVNRSHNHHHFDTHTHTYIFIYNRKWNVEKENEKKKRTNFHRHAIFDHNNPT